MKRFRLLCLSALLPLTAVEAQAAVHYAVKISGIYTNQFFNGSIGITTSAPVSNATILKAVLASGTSGETKASQMDIVVDDSIFNFSIDIIDRVSHRLVFALGRGTGNYSPGAAVYNVTKSGATHHEIASGYTLQFPNQASSETVNLNSSERENTVDKILNLTISIAGGKGFETNGATFFEGTVRKGTTEYDY